MKRPLPADLRDKALYLFGTNFDVNFFNYDKLSKLPGNMKIYQAKDKCPVQYLRTCSAPMVLPIKLNCKVMIIRNSDKGLVNGLTGTAIHMDDENICIRIDEDDKMDHNLSGCVYNIKKMQFVLHDENNKVVGNRWQFPLKLGYAVTVDKAQGRTLEFLVIDCYNFWHCGQLGVAIGRATVKYGSCCRLNVHDTNLANFHQIAFNIPPQANLQGVPSSITKHNQGHDTSNDFPYDFEDFTSGKLLEPITPIQQIRNNILLASVNCTHFTNF